MNANYLAIHADFMKTAAPIMDRYQERLDIVDEAIKAKKHPKLSLSDFDKATIAILLDNVDKELNRYKVMKNLSDRTFSETVGPFKKHAYNIITALYATLDIKDLVSFQPLTQKYGAIYKMVYKFASNKGSIREGATMFSPETVGTRARNYSTQNVVEEPVIWTFDTDSFAVLEYFPVITPAYISIVVATGAAAGTYTYLSTTDGIYNLQKDAGETIVGTLDPATGVATLTAVDATSTTGTLATYRYNSEKFVTNASIPRITIGVTEKLVQSERRQLLIDTMLDVSYDFETQFAKSLNSEMESTTIQFIQNEQAFRVLGEMFDGSTGNGGTSYTFDPDDCPTGVSLAEYAQVLFKILSAMAVKIRNNVGQGIGNKIVAGDNFIHFMKILPPDVYERSGVPKGNGPYYAGNLNGDYDIYHNPDMGATDFMMTWKGDAWWEAPYYIGSYLPLMNSQFLLYPDMHGEEGFISMESYNYEYPLMTVLGTVTT